MTFALSFIALMNDSMVVVPRRWFVPFSYLTYFMDSLTAIDIQPLACCRLWMPNAHAQRARSITAVSWWCPWRSNPQTVEARCEQRLKIRVVEAPRGAHGETQPPIRVGQSILPLAANDNDNHRKGPEIGIRAETTPARQWQWQWHVICNSCWQQPPAILNMQRHLNYSERRYSSPRCTFLYIF